MDSHTARRRRIGIALVSAVVAATLGGIAAAHTNVAESSPTAGARPSAAPAEVMVRFGNDFAPVQPGAVSAARLEVYDACGKQVDKKDSELTLQDSKVVVSSGGTVAGRYEIHWHATASDGAVQAGVIDFTVTKGSACRTNVRSDAAKDVDLGFDVTKLDSKRVTRGALIRVTTAAAVKCSSLTKKQTLELRFDTNGDQIADINGEVFCRRGAPALRLRNDDGVTGVLTMTRPAAKILAVKIKRHVLLGHFDFYAESALDSDKCDGKTCTDRAPDLGSVRGY